MKKDMVRASIYIEKSIWQGIRAEAHERWIPIGKLIGELYESRKVHEVHTIQMSEKVTRVKKPEKVESVSHTGADKKEGMGFIDEASSISEKAYNDIKKIVPKKYMKVEKSVEEIPGVKPASYIFNPQPKGKK